MDNKIIVSACLLGENCKYNGRNNMNEDLLKFLYDKEIIAICPEVLGGLCTPRLPSEIEFGKSSDDVLDLSARVINTKGKDVSKEFLLGAEKVLEIVRVNNIKLAVLKEGSPSCGSSFIYDGTFSSTKKGGMGITSKLLSKHGVRVLSEKNFMSEMI